MKNNTLLMISFLGFLTAASHVNATQASRNQIILTGIPTQIEKVKDPQELSSSQKEKNNTKESYSFGKSFLKGAAAWALTTILMRGALEGRGINSLRLRLRYPNLSEQIMYFGFFASLLSGITRAAIDYGLDKSQTFHKLSPLPKKGISWFTTFGSNALGALTAVKMLKPQPQLSTNLGFAVLYIGAGATLLHMVGDGLWALGSKIKSSQTDSKNLFRKGLSPSIRKIGN